MTTTGTSGTPSPSISIEPNNGPTTKRVIANNRTLCQVGWDLSHCDLHNNISSITFHCKLSDHHTFEWRKIAITLIGLSGGVLPIMFFHSRPRPHCDEQPLLTFQKALTLDTVRKYSTSSLAEAVHIPRPPRFSNSLFWNILPPTLLYARIWEPRSPSSTQKPREFSNLRVQRSKKYARSHQ